MDQNDSTTTAGDYQNSLNKYGESPKALLWSNYRIAAVRFKELVADLPIEGRSILDVGCGMGDLLPFLYAKSTRFDYLGVDTNKGFIEIAKKRYEGHAFQVLDPLNQQIAQFDLVICSGMLNGNVDDWLEKRKVAIARLFELANEALAFNMSGSFSAIPNTEITAYAHLPEIQAFCASLTPRLIMRHHYSPKGFTIVMFK